MKAAVVYGINDLRIQEVKTPKPAPGEILVKVRAAGICATDVKMLSGQGLPEKLPAILGHEVAGDVFAVGEGVKGIHPGERVTVYPIAVCGECYFCRRGRHNLCEKEFGLAHGIDGGFAQFVRIPAQIVSVGGVCKIPAHISYEQSVMAEPLSCCIAAYRTAGVKNDDTVLIIGAGPMGLFHLKVAQAIGARVIIADLIERRLGLAKKMGADYWINTQTEDLLATVGRLTDGQGADLVVAALGIPAVMEQYLPAVRKGGTFNIFGGPPAGNLIKVDPRWLHYGEIRLTGTFASTPADFVWALELISSHKIEVLDLISHRFSLEGMLDAVDLIKNRELIKGIVLID